MAEIFGIEPDWDYDLIAVSAGAAPGMALFWPGDRGRLVVPGVTQDALKNAVAGYDHVTVIQARKMRIIRAERNRRLIETDWQAIRAWEIGVDGPIFSRTHAGIYRQKLRDIPETIDLEAIQTPEELAAFEPEWPKL